VLRKRQRCPGRRSGPFSALRVLYRVALLAEFMSPHPSPSGSPSEGDSLATPEFGEALSAIRALAIGRYDVLGPLGRDDRGEFVFLGRDAVRDRLVVLKRRGGGGEASRTAALQVIEQLDSSVPPPAGSCPVCLTPFASWDPSCVECGTDVAGSAGVPGPGVTQEQLLQAVRNAAQGYEVLGGIPRAVGGAMVYFARDLPGGDLVALRLDQETGPGLRPGYTVAATRMMRPKLFYGTVGGDSSREPGRSGAGQPPWTPSPSPPMGTRAARGAAPSGSGVPFAGMEIGEKVCPQCGEVFGPELRFCPKDGSTLRARSRSEDLVGQVIAERYHIVAKLGQGGMGTVYLAEHVRMGRRCAVKVMNPRLLHDPDSVSRFSREAANASRITHPNVAAIYDFGETSDDIVYLAMEFVEGESLAATLGRERELPERRAIEIGRQVAGALGAAHELGIVHRDLKPDNIMVTRSRTGQDVVKVVDFGIAKATQGAQQTVTRKGFVVGTPAYMSPEQILGDTLDGRSDIYSLGCILYEMLTGERAFAGPSGEVSIHQRLTEPPPHPRRVKRNLSKELDAVVTTAMARSAEKRFQSAGAIQEALTAALSETSARPTWTKWLPWGRSRGSEAVHASAGAAGAGAAPHAISARSPVSPGFAPPPVSRVQPPATAPVPVGWTESVPPLPQSIRKDTTLLRHRSARPAGWRVGVLAGVCVGGVLLVYLLWRLLTPEPRLDSPVSTRERRTEPAPEPERTSTPTPGPAAETDTGVAPAESIPPPVLAGTVRLAEPLPRGARMTVDGKATNLNSDGELSLPPGAHTLGVRAPGFRPVTRDVEVASGETATVRLQLLPAEPAPQMPPSPTSAPGSIAISGPLPDGTDIRVDGRLLPPGSRLTTAAPGVHWVKVSALGYRPDSSRIEVREGSQTSWPVPQLEPLPRLPVEPAPQATPPKPPPAAVVKPDTSDAAESAPAPADNTAAIRQLLVEYESAINARSISRLKALYPAMPPERERQWRDLFNVDVRDLKATLSVTSIQAAGSAPEASFGLVLSFRPDREKPQTYRVRNQATLRHEAGGWRFVSLMERGEE
jgi:serine/threonine protein kinase